MNIHQFADDVADQLYSIFPLRDDVGIQFSETDKHFIVAITVNKKCAGFTVPKKYNNLWKLRVRRAVEETIENILDR
jgi:hypothetical protein